MKRADRVLQFKNLDEVIDYTIKKTTEEVLEKIKKGKEFGKNGVKNKV